MKKTILAAIVATAFAVPAFAQSDAAEYAELVKGSKLTYVQAGDIALKEVGSGTVVKSELDSHRLKVVFEVGVLTNDGRLYNVDINAVDGSVISSKEDID